MVAGEVAYSVYGAIILSIWFVEFNATPLPFSKLRLTNVPQYTVFLLLVVRRVEEHALAQVCALGYEGGRLAVTATINAVRVTTLWGARLNSLYAAADRVLHTENVGETILYRVDYYNM